MKNIKGVLLSAGKSSRMGELKALLRLNDKTVLDKLLKEYLDSNLPKLILVLGYKAKEIEKTIRIENKKLEITVNENYRREMFSSIQKGFSTIHNADAILLGLIDHPFITKEIIDTLISNYKEGEILLPAYGGRRGHPIILPFSLKEEILKADPLKFSLRDIIHKHENLVRVVAIDNEAILFDMDTKNDYERAKKYGKNKN